MNDVALYRKYRPQKFKDVIGQEHIVSVLEGAIQNKKIAHAYLFSGSRGIGKTSIARIFARELGCIDTDIYEIDAASNRGIDEIRELRDGVYSLPFGSPYKTYIIDEVHMLTTPAFNALLKTLEEPPAHVIFILATTEPHKLPETIISRCQHFSFKKPSEEELRKHLSAIAKKEGYTLDKESLTLLAFLGEGSFRDAIGTLQKVITISKDKNISVDEVEHITGAPRAQVIHELLESILNGDLPNALAHIRKISEANIDITVFVRMLMRDLRFAMLLLFAPELKAKISEEISKESLEFLAGLGKGERARLMPALLKELLSAYQEIPRSYIKELPLELALIRVLEQQKKE